MGTYEMKTGAKIIKGSANVLGIATMATSAVSIVGTLLKGEVYGAAIDLGATVLGVGVAYGTGYLAGVAIAGLSLVGAPAVIATGIGIGLAALGSYAISLGADYLKDKHYGR